MLSVVLDGVLFTFGIDIERSDRAELVDNTEWVFPVVDWRRVAFLAEAALQARRDRER